MTLRVSALLALLAAAVGLGCSGPTKTGKVVRAEARERVGRFSAGVTYQQAKQEFESGQFDRALQDVDLAIANAPDAPSFHLLRGRIFLEQGRLQKSLAAFEECASYDPELPDPHYFTGILHQRWSRDEEALAAYRRASELEPDNRQYLLAVAESLCTLDRFDEARDLVESTIKHFEYDPVLRQMLAEIARLSGDYDRAIRHYESARILAPNEEDLLEDLAWLYWQADRIPECLGTVELLLEQTERERPDLERLRARCLALVGRTIEAHRIFDRLVRVTPNEPDLWVEYGTVAWQAGDWRRLAQCGSRLMALSPNRWEGWLYQGLFERESGRTAEALRMFREASSRAEGAALPWMLYGRELEAAGQPSAALEAYRTAMELDPECDPARRLVFALAGSMNE